MPIICTYAKIQHTMSCHTCTHIHTATETSWKEDKAKSCRGDPVTVHLLRANISHSQVWNQSALVMHSLQLPFAPKLSLVTHTNGAFHTCWTNSSSLPTHPYCQVLACWSPILPATLTVPAAKKMPPQMDNVSLPK